jgi:hypothetical protein
VESRGGVTQYCIEWVSNNYSCHLSSSARALLLVTFIQSHAVDALPPPRGPRTNA